ncbi:MAG: hypothetical protein Q9212_004767, partial [Teloschistes hypoglaucus]
SSLPLNKAGVVGKHTILILKPNRDIIMFPRVLRHIQAYKVGIWVRLALWQRELGVGDADIWDAGPRKRLTFFGTLDDEIHACTVAEVLEESEKLDRLLMSDDLYARGGSLPPLMYGHHAPPGNGEAFRQAIEKNGEPSKELLKRMQIVQ